MNSQILQKNNQRHPFHLVDPSPWPFVGSIGGLGMTFGGVMFMHNYSGGWSLFCLGFATILYTMYAWWRDIIREGTFGHKWYMRLLRSHRSSQCRSYTCRQYKQYTQSSPLHRLMQS